MWEIVCDKGRESPIQFLEELSPYKLRIEQITNGDYAIIKNDAIKVIIERKTWTDLADTIKSPVRKNNHERLLELREKTGCIVLYIIEGAAFYHEDKIINKVPHKNLLAYLDHIAFRDNCRVIQTLDIRDTAMRIISLVRNISTITDTANITTVSVVGDGESNVELLKERKDTSDIVIKQNVYMQMRGVTVNTIRAVEHYTIKELFTKVTNVELSKLKYASGRELGIKKANEILNNRTNTLVHAKMLSAIPKLTKDTAKIILSHTTLLELCDLDKDSIAKIIKSRNINKKGIIKETKIGDKLATTIKKIIK